MPNEIYVLGDRCTGCTRCVRTCPVDAISMAERPSHPKKWKLAVIDEKCVFCNACVVECDTLAEKTGKGKEGLFHAIVMHKEEVAGPALDPTHYKGVWCYAEQRHGKLMPTIYELLHVGRQLAGDLNEPLCAVLIGHKVAEAAGSLIEHGADVVYVCDHPIFEHFLDEAYTQAMTDLILKEKPNKLLMPASTIGRSFASRVAIAAQTGITADATGLSIDKKSRMLHATRPSFGGNLMATILCERHRPEMATVRPMAFPRAEKVPGRKGEIIQVPIDPSKIKVRAKFVRFIPEESGIQDITGAERIVSGGRGLGRADGFELIRDLAKELGAAVGASRAAVDIGWIPYRHQVGLTGRTVRPKLYVACGISGQIQHLAGMSSSEVVVAVNTDTDAPMMKLATFSIEGNLYEVIPALIAELRKQRG